MPGVAAGVKASSRSRILRVRGFCTGTNVAAYGKEALRQVSSRRVGTFFPQGWNFFPAETDLFSRRDWTFPHAG